MSEGAERLMDMRRMLDAIAATASDMDLLDIEEAIRKAAEMVREKRRDMIRQNNAKQDSPTPAYPSPQQDS